MTVEQKILILRANDYSLGDMIDEFKSDKQIVLEAVKYHSGNLKYASEGLKKDEDVLACALESLCSDYFISGEDRTGDIEKFFEEVGVDFEEVKSKVGGMLIYKGYDIPEGATYEEFFGKGFIPEVIGEDGGLRLDIVDELEGLVEKKEEIKWELQHGEGNTAELETELDTIQYRMCTLYGKALAWEREADIYQRLTVTAAQPAIHDSKTIVPGKYGVRLEELLNASEVKKNEDFFNKLIIFREKCASGICASSIVEASGKFINGDFVCERLEGNYSLINDDAQTGIIDFSTGEVYLYADSIIPEWRIDDRHTDETIVDSKLSLPKHSITEVKTVVADRTLGAVDATVRGIKAEAENIPTKEEQK